MGLPLWRSSGAVRLSFGPLAASDFIDEACARIRRCGQALRGAVLVPSALSGTSHGLLQLSADGRHGWIAFDLAARACVVIDPPLALAPRIASMIAAQGLAVTAVLGTGADPDGAAARTALRTALGGAPTDPGTLGWPGEAGEITVGGLVLARLPAEGTRAGYLLDTPDGVRLAFTGDADGARLQAPIGRTLVLCHAADLDGLAFRTPGNADTGSDAAQLAPMQLDPAALDGFLRSHPDALLVDVREQAEAAAGACVLHGHAAVNVPLSRLAEHLGRFLATPRPLVFVCRSGNRSARATLCLRRAGHAQAWTLNGGMALALG
jgi:cysteine desulfurase